MKERIRYIYRLNPGAGPEYDEFHTRVPGELLQLIRDAGISNYTVWRHEEIVVCEFDTSLGFERTRAILAASPVQKAWTAQLLHLFDKIDQEDGQPQWLEEMFRLD